MHIFVQIAENEYFIVVSDWLAFKEFFWLFESSLMFMNLISLCVEDKTVRNPTVVASED